MKEKGTLTRDKARFIFQVPKNEIALEIDLKGNESVFLNGAIVDSRRSFRLSGCYSIPIAGSEYRLHIRVRNPITGVIDAKLLEHENVLSHQRAKVKLGEKYKILSFLLLAAGCAGLGVAVARGLLPIWLTIVLYVVVVVSTMSIRGKNYVIRQVRT